MYTLMQAGKQAGSQVGKTKIAHTHTQSNECTNGLGSATAVCRNDTQSIHCMRVRETKRKEKETHALCLRAYLNTQTTAWTAQKNNNDDKFCTLFWLEVKHMFAIRLRF